MTPQDEVYEELINPFPQPIISVPPIMAAMGWQMTSIQPAISKGYGSFHLVGIAPTARLTGEELKIIVSVYRENGILWNDMPVAYAYTTAPHGVYAPPGSLWSPPAPLKAELYPNRLGVQEGAINSIIKEGQAGGVSIYIFQGAGIQACVIPSDVVFGCGCLPDHGGMHLSFKYFAE